MRETLANLLRMGLEQCRQVGDQLIETGVNCAISRKLRAHLASVESEFRLEVLPGFVDQVGVSMRPSRVSAMRMPMVTIAMWTPNSFMLLTGPCGG
jgi:hypothetical protein